MGASRPDASRVPARGALFALLSILAAISGGSMPALGQELARPRLEGRVLRSLDDTVGVASAMVVLHRITPDTAAEIDSLRTDSGGAFAFDLPSVPEPLIRGDVYLASVNHQSILYFGPPVHEAVQLDSLYRIQVHDTTLAPEGGAGIPLQLRYLVLDPAEAGWIVTDVLQIENTGQNTLVRPDGEVVWRYPLPQGATDLEVGDGDASPDAVVLRDGVLEVSAPISPGVKEYLVRYRLPERRLDVPLPGRVGQVELLVQEPAPQLAVTGLMLNQPAEMQPGVTYRRFSALDVEDTRVLVLPGVAREAFPLEWLVVIMAFILAGGALWAIQRSPDAVPAGVEVAEPLGPEERERLLLEVARVEERLDAEALDTSEKEVLTTRRQALMEALRRLG